MKYKQRGYQEDERADERRPQERRPRRDPDLPGGRLAEPQRALRGLRCHDCGSSLALETDARGDVLPIPRDAQCPECESAIHACRNCLHFDPDAAFECRKSVKPGYKKREANDCQVFEPKLVVELTRDEARGTGSFSTPVRPDGAPKTQSDARKAFDDLFK